MHCVLAQGEGQIHQKRFESRSNLIFAHRCKVMLRRENASEDGAQVSYSYCHDTTAERACARSTFAT